MKQINMIGHNARLDSMCLISILNYSPVININIVKPRDIQVPFYGKGGIYVKTLTLVIFTYYIRSTIIITHSICQKIFKL